MLGTAGGKGERVHRITITLDDELMDAVDGFAASGGHGSRSEAMRDLVRAGLLQQDAGEGDADCVAALVYVYDHEARQLARRLTESFHAHHGMTVSTMHVHLNHRDCVELTVLRGPATQVRALGRHVMAERGVRHGRLLVLPATP